MSDFKSLNLTPAIFQAITKKGYTIPTPIQAKAIPHLLQGKDILGIAQTGTGKTAAFSLPIINHLHLNKKKVRAKSMRTLILTPTRELASQIVENINSYSENLKISCTVIFGGVNQNPQVRKMSRGSDIVVATPGRLLDLLSQGHINLSEIEVFVLDEADRMLDMGFIHDIKKLVARIPKQRQTLLFSATMPDDIARLANSLLHKPVRVEVTPQATTVEKIDQRVNIVARTNKAILLKNILKDQEIKSVLVFARTKRGANKIVEHLDKESISSAAIHGNKSQGARERALGGFKSGNIRVLVATDIAARGIDVPQVSHVINYDLPDDPKSYVHRIGRTARAGREGVAISFCEDSEMELLKSIQKFIRFEVPIDKTHAFHGVPGKKVSPSNAGPRGGQRFRRKKKSSTNSSRR